MTTLQRARNRLKSMSKQNEELKKALKISGEKQMELSAQMDQYKRFCTEFYSVAVSGTTPVLSLTRAFWLKRTRNLWA